MPVCQNFNHDGDGGSPWSPYRAWKGLTRTVPEMPRNAFGELLPGVKYSEEGDAFSLSFPTEVTPKPMG